MAKKTKPQGVFSMQINEHLLTGEKRRGKWTFTCNTWPDIPEAHNTSHYPSYAIEQFVYRAAQLLISSISAR